MYIPLAMYIPLQVKLVNRGVLEMISYQPIDLNGLHKHFIRLRGNTALLPDASIIVPVNAQGDLENILELFLNKIERSSTAQHRCQRHHPQNQLYDGGRPAPKWWSVSYRQWPAQ
jgi:hypothetical protein